MVELAAHVAVVEQAQVGAFGQSGARQARGSEAQLLRRKGEAGDMHAELARGDFRESAPAAADFQQPVTRFRIQAPQDTTVLGGLRRFQGSRMTGVEQRAGICHGRIEPEPVEIVAQVVMGLDILARAGAGIAVEQVPDPIQGIADKGSVDRPLKRRAVAAEQLDQRRRIVDMPAAFHAGFRKTDVAAFHAHAYHVPVRQHQVHVRQRCRSFDTGLLAERAFEAIRTGKRDPAAAHA